MGAEFNNTTAFEEISNAEDETDFLNFTGPDKVNITNVFTRLRRDTLLSGRTTVREPFEVYMGSARVNNAVRWGWGRVNLIGQAGLAINACESYNGKRITMLDLRAPFKTDRQDFKDSQLTSLDISKQAPHAAHHAPYMIDGLTQESLNDK